MTTAASGAGLAVYLARSAAISLPAFCAFLTITTAPPPNRLGEVSVVSSPGASALASTSCRSPSSSPAAARAAAIRSRTARSTRNSSSPTTSVTAAGACCCAGACVREAMPGSMPRPGRLPRTRLGRLASAAGAAGAASAVISLIGGARGLGRKVPNCRYVRFSRAFAPDMRPQLHERCRCHIDDTLWRTMSHRQRSGAGLAPRGGPFRGCGLAVRPWRVRRRARRGGAGGRSSRRRRPRGRRPRARCRPACRGPSRRGPVRAARARRPGWPPAALR